MALLEYNRDLTANEEVSDDRKSAGVIADIKNFRPNEGRALIDSACVCGVRITNQSTPDNTYRWRGIDVSAK